MKISVITVTYNSSTFLLDCLRSVNSQIRCSKEHIVVDGLSTDGTVELLEANRSQFSVLLSEPDCGIYDAMNKGIAHARGDVIGFLNSDDVYEDKNVLSRVVEIFLGDPSLDACYADLVYTAKFDISRVVRYWISSGFSVGNFSYGWCPPHPTFFVRRSVYERFGSFDLSYRTAADVELMMRFLEIHKLRVQYVPEVWVRMRMGGTSNKSLRNIWFQNEEVLRALRSHGLPAHRIRFLGHKLVSRGVQYIRRLTR